MVSALPRALLTTALACAAVLVHADQTTTADGRYVIQSWDTDDGLPHSMVDALIKRKDGFIWIATFAGIARFDGIDFTPVLSPLVQTDKSRSVHCLIEENPATLLLACDNTGLLQLKDGEITTHPATAHFPSGQQVVALFSERPDVFWIAFSNFEVWRSDHGTIEKYPLPQTLQSNGQVSFARDLDGRVFVARGAGIERYQDRALMPVPGAPPEDVTLGSSRTGGAWAVTATRIFRLEGDGIALLAKAVAWPGNTPPTVLKESQDGALWVGLSGNGVWRWTPHECFAVTSLSSIADISEDDAGNLWFALAGGGLQRLGPTYFSILAPDADWLRGSSSVCADTAGDIWYANTSGIHRLTGLQESPLPSPQLWPKGALPICADPSGNIWFAVNERLCRARAGKSEPPEWLPAAGSTPVHSIFATRDGSVWVGRTSGPMERYRGPQPEIFGAESGYPGTSVAQAIGEDAAGHVWVGTKNGELFEFANGHFHRFSHEDGLPGGDIRAIYGDAQGTLWVGTHGGGLVIRQGGRFLRVAGAQGLPDEIISQLLEDESGALWFGTSRRLFRVYKKELIDCALGRTTAITPITYSRSDGLAGFSAIGSYQPTAWKSANGRLWFVSRKGLVTVDPARLRTEQPDPRAYLDRMVVDGRPAVEASPRFSTAARKYEFHFTCPEYIAPQDIRYRYRLEGLEADWSEPIAERKVSYSNLPSGSYRFRVTACNGNLIWNSTEAQLAFLVVPVWWETLWARLAMVVLAGTGLAWLVRYFSLRRLRSRLARLEMIQRVEQERARIARDLHDGLGASLTRMSLMAEEMSQDTDNFGDLKAQSSLLVGRVRTIARDLEWAVWTASPEYDTLSALCSYLSQYALEYFASTPIRCLVDVAPDIPPVPIPPEIRHHVCLIAKESMNNVLKHSQATRVELALRLRDGIFEAILTDNGKGFDPAVAAATERHGLRNMQTRGAEAHGSLEVRSSAEGTVVRFSLDIEAVKVSPP